MNRFKIIPLKRGWFGKTNWIVQDDSMFGTYICSRNRELGWAFNAENSDHDGAFEFSSYEDAVSAIKHLNGYYLSVR